MHSLAMRPTHTLPALICSALALVLTAFTHYSGPCGHDSWGLVVHQSHHFGFPLELQEPSALTTSPGLGHTRTQYTTVSDKVGSWITVVLGQGGTYSLQVIAAPLDCNGVAFFCPTHPYASWFCSESDPFSKVSWLVPTCFTVGYLGFVHYGKEYMKLRKEPITSRVFECMVCFVCCVFCCQTCKDSGVGSSGRSGQQGTNCAAQRWELSP